MNRIKAYTITITPSPKKRVNNMTNILSKNQTFKRMKTQIQKGKPTFSIS